TEAARVRATIANLFLHEHESQSAPCVGSVALRPHQRSAVGRVRRALSEFGGALLADDVGLGKTFVAVALIRESNRTLVVAPAALARMWHDALERGGARAHVVSYDALSRGRVPNARFDLVVLDEAHHARNPSTKRYARIAALTCGARPLPRRPRVAAYTRPTRFIHHSTRTRRCRRRRAARPPTPRLVEGRR